MKNKKLKILLSFSLVSLVAVVGASSYFVLKHQNNDVSVLKNNKTENEKISSSEKPFRNDVISNLLKDIYGKSSGSMLKIDSFVLDQQRKENEKYIFFSLKDNFLYFNGLTFFYENPDPNDLYINVLQKSDIELSKNSFINFITKDWYLFLKTRNMYKWVGSLYNAPNYDNAVFSKVFPNADYTYKTTSNHVVEYKKLDFDNYFYDDAPKSSNILLKFSDNTFQRLTITYSKYYQGESFEWKQTVYAEPRFFAFANDKNEFEDVPLDMAYSVLYDEATDNINSKKLISYVVGDLWN
ncbi:hypothetical protein [[Mycoplasma] gypis]|uniref:Uncharacterized protein n=1 Tax=[Mycoplasma] gypis TaxID=92404 RepID=A0ABZ2RPK6_9BACT|nr:hypothetical protein [[Mycoplasma] gypis]MBN0919489.1 hypothetical protein [[Mycoplasma] gypis]